MLNKSATRLTSLLKIDLYVINKSDDFIGLVTERNQTSVGNTSSSDTFNVKSKMNLFGSIKRADLLN